MRPWIWMMTLSLAAAIGASAHAALVTFSGNVTYDGSSSGDSLYVAVLDTTGVEDVTLLAVGAFKVGSPPFSQPYSFQFDNTGAGPQLLIASFLDVDGGGLADIGGLDVFGWYDGQQIPVSVSSATSHSGLDFELPTGEIHGNVSFGAGQIEARIDASPDPNCVLEGFRPGTFVFSGGAYSIIGVYPGSYCVFADGSGDFGFRRVCHGDPSCANPVLVDVGDGEVIIGVDLHFNALATEQRSWGGLKSRFR